MITTNKLPFIHIVFVVLISFPIKLSLTEQQLQEWNFDFTNTHKNNANSQKTYGCTHSLPTINKKLCILQTNDGAIDFIFEFKNNYKNIQKIHNSQTKQLSDYYDNITLKFNNDNHWNSIEPIDNSNGYQTIKKCQYFTWMQMCAIYNPYTNNLNIQTNVTDFIKKAHRRLVDRLKHESQRKRRRMRDRRRGRRRRRRRRGGRYYNYGYRHVQPRMYAVQSYGFQLAGNPAMPYGVAYAYPITYHSMKVPVIHGAMMHPATGMIHPYTAMPHPALFGPQTMHMMGGHGVKSKEKTGMERLVPLPELS